MFQPFTYVTCHTFPIYSFHTINLYKYDNTLIIQEINSYMFIRIIWAPPDIK